MSKELEPVDRKRCQAEIVTTRNNTWQLGGRPERTVERCAEKAAHVVTEKNPGKDGRRGAMSLCPACLEKFRVVLDLDNYELEEIAC